MEHIDRGALISIFPETRPLSVPFIRSQKGLHAAFGGASDV